MASVSDEREELFRPARTERRRVATRDDGGYEKDSRSYCAGDGSVHERVAEERFCGRGGVDGTIWSVQIVRRDDFETDGADVEHRSEEDETVGEGFTNVATVSRFSVKNRRGIVSKTLRNVESHRKV